MPPSPIIAMLVRDEMDMATGRRGIFLCIKIKICCKELSSVVYTC